MSTKEGRYYESRAEAELELAQRATHPGAVKAHYELAERYLDLVYGCPVQAETSMAAVE